LELVSAYNFRKLAKLAADLALVEDVFVEACLQCFELERKAEDGAVARGRWCGDCRRRVVSRRADDDVRADPRHRSGEEPAT
jgi:hypothetical protein